MKRTRRKYYIKTFGCQMNFSDSERITSFFEQNDLKPTEDINQANLVIFNTCGVRQTAEDRVFGQVHNLRKKNPDAFVIVTGCIAHRKDVQKKLKEKVDLFISINDLFKLTIPRKESQKNFKGRNNKKHKIPLAPPFSKGEECRYLTIDPQYNNNKKILIPIMTGCNNFCSYCVVPFARGREKSRPAHQIIKEIKKAKKNGCKEVLLLGQNVNSYIHKVKTTIQNSKIPSNAAMRQYGNAANNAITFPALLEHLASNFPKIHFNFLTSHPKDFSDQLIDVIAKNKNISKQIHLPIQSGSDKVLKDMNRPYTKKHYLELIRRIQTQIPTAKITTDVIVGFPTETQKEFRQTLEVFKKIQFQDAYVNKYSPRPGTAAEKLGDPVSWEEKKRREKTLRSLLTKKTTALRKQS